MVSNFLAATVFEKVPRRAPVEVIWERQYASGGEGQEVSTCLITPGRELLSITYL